MSLYLFKIMEKSLGSAANWYPELLNFVKKAHVCFSKYIMIRTNLMAELLKYCGTEF